MLSYAPEEFRKSPRMSTLTRRLRRKSWQRKKPGRECDQIEWLLNRCGHLSAKSASVGIEHNRRECLGQSGAEPLAQPGPLAL